jgi:hypothetical protein
VHLGAKQVRLGANCSSVGATPSISEFSPEAWTALVESVTIHANDDIRFNFRNGMSL